MNGEADALKNLGTGKGHVRLHGNGNKLHKNGVENGKSGLKNSEDFEQTPIWIAVMTYIAYAILILFGYLRDFMRFYGLEKSRAFKERGNKVSYGNR
jgi:serine palmitoyltransferase